MSHRRFPAFYRFAAALALLAMLVPLVTSVVHHPAAMRTLAHICGVDHPGDAHRQAPVKKLPSCPVCHSLHHMAGGYVPPVPPALPLAFAAVVAILGSARIFRVRLRVFSQSQPRAPPVSV